MTVHDAKPSDIYVDKGGKLWRCISICHEPTVSFEAVEGYVPSPAGLAGMQGGAQAMLYIQATPQIVKPRQRGGVSGLMWEGWKRIYRSDAGS